MNENDIQNLTQEQLVIILSLAIRKIRTDIAFLKSKAEREGCLNAVRLTASQSLDLGILQGLILADNVIRDVYFSGIWKSQGGAHDE